jgi:hypothetical protein
MIYCMTLLLALVASQLRAEENDKKPYAIESEVTLYSCDNPKVESPNAAPCFPPNDPNYMTVALRKEIDGKATRFKDLGDGIAATVLDYKKCTLATFGILFMPKITAMDG